METPAGGKEGRRGGWMGLEGGRGGGVRRWDWRRGGREGGREGGKAGHTCASCAMASRWRTAFVDPPKA